MKPQHENYCTYTQNKLNEKKQEYPYTKGVILSGFPEIKAYNFRKTAGQTCTWSRLPCKPFRA